MLKKRFSGLILIITLFISLGFPHFLLADEGLWPFNMVPLELIKKKYGINLTKEWLDHLRLASIRFGGASASFVSPDGLVLTNHHVGQRAIQNLSTPEKDLMKTGFYARTREEELKCPGLELWVLQEIEDVTSQVLAAEKPGMKATEAAQAREKIIAQIEKEAFEKSGLRSIVVTLYSGGMYHLYKYKIYTDVRLVFAPEFAIAFFGGDPDNFTYPRYDLDIAFFRAYENGLPAKTPHYLKWSRSSVKEGEVVFASGNPGSTGRLLTLAQLEFLRDINYPFTIANYQRRRALLQKYSDQGPEQARIALNTLFSIENSLKAVTGYQSGLLDPKIMEKKAKEEAEIRKAVNENPDLAREFGRAWDEIAAAQKTYAEIFKPLTFFERAQGFNTVYFSMARNLVRLALERQRPNELRLREYREANLPSLERSILSPTPIYDDFEIVKLADSLAQLKEELGNVQEVRWLLGNRKPEEVAKELVTGTKLKDIEFRKKLLQAKPEEIYQVDDPMIKLALLIDPISRGWRAKYEKEVESIENTNGGLIARAIFKLKGTTVPPDATSTLRLSFGVVKGYREAGRWIPFQTNFAGLYERARQFGFKFPYELPESFIQKKNRLNLKVPLNFVATVDSIGGNSGSPVVNVRGEIVGVLFDGNIQSLPNRFVYTEELARSVMVHAQGIIEALLKIYEAKDLVRELLPSK
ncbi:MAG: S46 family peptidase [Candidatus Aminicenantes bacterium]|nr:S46 family peptidase [Candidatus Aminicenantes bacterium]